DLAELNVSRAVRDLAAGDADAALIFAEQALINAGDALLVRDGYSANSHVVRFSYPRLPAVYAGERGLIDQIRSARNTAQYDASGGVTPAFAAQAIQLADRAVKEVRAAL
ncbi:MAG: HEPN domain-containing protein, partial [Chloroflexi bacterium]|nr:HEPN domain-containing protein [Chloroflexota bacterium]